MTKRTQKGAAKLLINAFIVTSLLLCLGFLSLVYKYKDEKTPVQVFYSVYYKIFGLPSTPWSHANPKNEGMDINALEKLSKSLEAYNTQALIIVRGGNIVFERYKDARGKTTKFSTAAMAKAVTAVPVLLMALSEGKISLDEPLWKYYPKLKNDPVRSQILIKHLVQHTSGIEDVDFYAGKYGKLTGWMDEYYKNPAGRFLYSMTEAPVTFTPGSREEYAGIGYYALAYAVTRSLQQLEYKDIDSYLREKLMHPLEIPNTSWNLSYGKSHLVDGMNLYAFGSGARYTARATARVGELILNRGKWNGKHLIEPETIDQLLESHTDKSSMVSENHGWTLNVNKRWPSLPADAIAGLGGGHQITLVVPGLDLVVVRHGQSFHGDDTIYQGEIYTRALDEKLFRPLVDSVIGPSSRMTH